MLSTKVKSTVDLMSIALQAEREAIRRYSQLAANMREGGNEAAAALFERMVDDAMAELMVGVNTDPQFGQLLVIASGGVLVELLQDAVTLLLPTTDAQIEAALRQLRCFRLLEG